MRASMLVAVATLLGVSGSIQTHRREWPVYGGDPGGMRYSALTDINRDNVSGLTSAWSWATGEGPIRKPIRRKPRGRARSRRRR